MHHSAGPQPPLDLLLGLAADAGVGQQHIGCAYPALDQGADLAELVLELRWGECGIRLLCVLALQYKRSRQQIPHTSGFVWRSPGAVEGAISAPVVGVRERLHRLPPHLP